jgi:hypothetical protein
MFAISWERRDRDIESYSATTSVVVAIQGKSGKVNGDSLVGQCILVLDIGERC